MQERDPREHAEAKRVRRGNQCLNVLAVGGDYPANADTEDDSACKDELISRPGGILPQRHGPRSRERYIARPSRRPSSVRRS